MDFGFRWGVDGVLEPIPCGWIPGVTLPVRGVDSQALLS